MAEHAGSPPHSASTEGQGVGNLGETGAVGALAKLDPTTVGQAAVPSTVDLNLLDQEVRVSA